MNKDMENKDKFHNIKSYLSEFISNIRENDPLPVRAPSYEVSESEIDGQILDIVYHYLNQRGCHPYIRHLVAHRVWSRLRNSDDPNGLLQNKLPYYDSIKLIKDVTNVANSTIRDILCNLTPSVTDKIPPYMQISHYWIKNSRRKMEDRCIILQDLNTLYDMKFGYPHAYYAVFDGHCGPDGAVYAAAHLHQFLIQNPLYSTNIEAALKHAFHICDTNFLRHAKSERLKGGTTAVVALVRENRLVVAWLGDSQALLVRKRNAAHVGEPHTPSRECERKRIDDMGGAVLDIGGTWRVLGQLAVSRAIGDADYKPYISSECDIKSLEISGDEDFLILACDGLWDTLSPKEAVNLVYAYLTQNDGDTDGVGKCLVEAARLAGSEDNITAVVVFLRPVTTLMEEEAIRVERGEVTDVGQVVPVTKDSQPNFITNLFSQPPIMPAVVKSENIFNAINQLAAQEGPPFEEPAPDYDTDNAEENDVIPTDEEVDAVLAELDSIPDAPEDNEDSSDDSEWTYAKVEPRTHIQIDDVLPDAMFPEDTSAAASNVDPLTLDEADQPTETPPVFPTHQNSLRTVEGFITSVELNGSHEAFTSDININATADLSLETVEQPSGPVSVYVSSSPEPASIEIVEQTQASMPPFVQESATNNQENMSQVCKESFSVEIIHAQSTIEVMPNSLKEKDSIVLEIPDIMMQSFTGEIPIVPSNLLDLDQSPVDQPLVQLDNDALDVDFIPQLICEDSEISELQVDLSDLTVKTDAEIKHEPLIPVHQELDIFSKPDAEGLVESVPVMQQPDVAISLLEDDIDPINVHTIDEEKVSLVQEQTTPIAPVMNLVDLKKADEKPLADIVNEGHLLDNEEADVPEPSNVEKVEEDTRPKKKLPEAPKKSDTPSKRIVPTYGKKLPPSTQLRASVTKDSSKQTPIKSERTTARRPMMTKEVAKPPPKKEPILKKATTSRTASRITAVAAAPKTNSSLTKLVAAPKPLSKVQPSKQLESPSHDTSIKTAERTKRPSPAVASKSRATVMKSAEKGATPATKATSAAPPRRSMTTPRPTVASTARTAAMTTSRSAAFAPPTKDTKNTANKLLSSKTAAATTNSTSRTKVLAKTTPITQKRTPTNKPATGMKTKCADKPSPKVKDKQEILANGNSANSEKESCVEKTEVITNGQP